MEKQNCPDYGEKLKTETRKETVGGVSDHFEVVDDVIFYICPECGEVEE